MRKANVLLAVLVLAAGAASAISPVYVSPTGSNSNSGASWAAPKQSLYSSAGNGAMDVVDTGGQIWMKQGTYNFAGNSGQGNSIYISKNMLIYGGFAGNETALNQRSNDASLTIISGVNGGGTNVKSRNVFRLATGLTSVRLDCLTIRDGDASGNQTAGGDSRGGGVYCDSSGLTLNNCIVTQNRARTAGAGASISNAAASSYAVNITDCQFAYNNPLIAELAVGDTDNRLGGGLELLRTDAVVEGCIFSYNNARYGGGIYVVLSYTPTSGTTGTNVELFPQIKNNVFYANTVLQSGAGIFSHHASSRISNCTFVKNVSQPGQTESCPQISCVGADNAYWLPRPGVSGAWQPTKLATPYVWNCLDVQNTGTYTVYGVTYPSPSYASQLNASNNQDLSADTSPTMFTNYAGGIFRPVSSTGATTYIIDKCTTFPPGVTLGRDCDGTARPQGSSYDRGAYEFDQSAPAAPSAPDLAAADDSGYSNTDNETSQTTALTFSGTAEANSTVKIYVNSAYAGQVAAVGGNYAFELDRTQGTYDIYVTATDYAGNTSANSGALTLIVDTTGPGAPGTPTDAGAYSTSTSLTFNWTAATDNLSGIYNYTWQVATDTGFTQNLQQGTTAGLSCTVTGANGNTYYCRARAQDQVGLNGAFSSASDGILVDTAAPTGSIAIENGAAYTIDTDVTLNLTYSDSPSGMSGGSAGMRFSNDNSAWGSWITPAATASWTLASGDGAKTVYVQYRDAAGNVSTGTISDTIVLDTAPPTGSISILNGASYTTSTSVTLNLTYGDTLSGMSGGLAGMRFSNDNSAWGGWAAPAATAAWTLTSGDGTKTVYVQYRDAAGNVTSATISDTIIMDTTPPNTPSIPDLDAADDSGFSNSDNITNQTTGLTLSGTADAGIAITLQEGATVLGSGVATGGVYSIDISLAPGVHNVTATATDPAGNPATSAALQINVDTSASAPSVPDLAAADDTGVSNTDNITRNTSGLTLAGTAEPGAFVEIKEGASVLGSGAASGGNYSIDISLAEGVHNVTATATDVAGNVSAPSSTLQVTIDTTAPGAPSVPDLAAVDDSGVSNTDNITNVTAGLTFGGTAETGATVTILEGVTALGSGVAAGGNYAVDVSLAEGVHNVSATATDVAGNVSSPSSTLQVTIDTTGPAAPSIPDLADEDDSGSSNSDNITNVTTGLTLSGTAEVGSTVYIKEGTTTLGSGVATGGNYSIDISLSEGVHDVAAVTTDVAGNDSPIDQPLEITVDTTINTPSVPDLAAADDTGSSSTDNITSRTTGLTLSGTAEAGATVAIKEGATVLASGVATGGNYSIDISLAEGVHSVTATATDTAGNVSSASAGLSITVDTSISTPSVPDLLAADDSGSSSIDNITNVTTGLTLNGTADTGATVEIKEGATVLGSGTAAGGSYSIDISLAAGVHNVTATSTDTAGNTATSAALQITVDTTVNAPSAPDLLAADDTGASNSDNLTNLTNGLTLTGTAEAGSTVTIYEGATVRGSGVATGGNYSIDISLTEGVHTVAARAVDVAGNTSALSSGLTITVDTSIVTPSVPDLSIVDDTGASSGDNITNLTTGLTLSGTAETGVTVAIKEGASVLGSVVASAGTYTIDLTLAEGSHDLTATATDTAGNVSPPSGVLTLIVDITPPYAPAQGEPIDVYLDDFGNISLTIDDIKAMAINALDAVGIDWLKTYGTALPSSFTCANVTQTEPVTFHVWDLAGNTAANDTTAGATVKDDIAPVADAVPGPVVVKLSDPTLVGIDLENHSTDNCDVVEYRIDGQASKTYTCSDIGDLIETQFTVLDVSGNANTDYTYVRVEDDIPPTARCVAPFELPLDENGQASLTPGDIDNGSFDNCTAAPVVLSISRSDFTCADLGLYMGPIPMTLTVRDAVPLTSTCTVDVTVVDHVKPIITLNGDPVVAFTERSIPSYDDPWAVAADNCDMDVPVNRTGSVNVNLVGAYTLTYTASDDSGNAADPVQRVVQIVPDQPPVITLIGDNPLTQECGSAYIDPGAMAQDHEDGVLTPTLVSNNVDVDTPTAGTPYLVVWSVTDSYGTLVEKVRQVFVRDVTPPVLHLIGGAVIEHECHTPYADLGATASDTCEGDLSAEISAVAPVDEYSPVGTYSVRYNVSDTRGNAATELVRTVNVVDTTKPLISLLGPSEVVHECGALYNDFGAFAEDSCEGDLSQDIVAVNPVSANSGPGVYQVTFNLMDVNGNAADEVIRTVTVVDTKKPIINLIGGARIVVLRNTSFTDPGVVATDQCEGDISDRVVVGGDIVDTAVEGDYVITYDVTDSEGNVARQVYRVVKVVGSGGPPIIVENPLNQTVVYGQNATFSVLATSAGSMTYQWTRNGVPLSEGTDYSGTNMRTLTVIGAANEDEGAYRCEVSNMDGPALSNPATLVVSDPAITQEPVDQALGNGETATFAVQAVGSGTLTYQWFRVGSTATPISNVAGKITGATTNTLQILNIVEEDEGVFLCRVTGADGTISSRQARLKIGDPVIVTDPQSQIVPPGTTVYFTVVAEGTPPLFYQWKKNGVNIADSGKYSGTRTSQLRIVNVQDADEGQYSVAVIGINIVYSNPATLIVGNPPVIDRVIVSPSDGNVFVGGFASFTVVMGGGSEPFTYQWRRNGVDLADTSRMAGSNGPILTINDALPEDQGIFTVRVTNEAGSAISAPSAIFIGLRFTLDLWGQLAAAGRPMDWYVDVAGGIGQIVFQWYRVDTGTKALIPIENGGTISGADTNHLRFDPVSLEDAGLYQVGALDTYSNILSRVAELRVTASLPLAGMAGLAALCALVAGGGIRILRRKR